MVAAMLGKPLMDWQQHVANVILEIDPETGALAYDEWVLTVPRQSGKSTFILAKSTHRASATKFFGGRQNVVYTAQTRQAARKKWENDYAAELQHSSRFKSKVDIRTGNGFEHIRFPNGSQFGIEANTEKSGHGGTLDEVYIDEAFAQVDNRLEQAFGPAMITRRNKQLGVVSTAGWSDASPYLLAKVEIGRKQVESDTRRGTAYFEWSAPDDADPSDLQTWLGCMPALHRPECGPRCRAHTVTIAAIRSEYDKAQLSGKLSDFRRAYLNQWLPKPKEAEETALGNWSSCAVGAMPDDLQVEAIGLACSLDRSWASIGAATTLPDDRVFVAAVDRRPDVDWAVAEVVRIQRERRCALVVDEKGPAGDLVPLIEDAGGVVTKANLSDYVQACADMSDRVKARQVAHLNHPDLNDAVVGARWRTVGDRRVFGRKVSVTDVSMLESVTLAMSATRANYDLLDSVL